MTAIGYHASHEQFAPSDLLEWVQLADGHGFEHALASDHFHPWSEQQGESGFVWSWLGSAMEATDLTFGTVNAPGYRYHPRSSPRPPRRCVRCIPNGSGSASEAASYSTRELRASTGRSNRSETHDSRSVRT